MTRRRELLKVTRPRGLTPPIIPRPFRTVGFSQVNKKKQETNLGKHQSMQALDGKPNDLARYPNDAKSAADKQSLNIDRMDN